MTEVQRPRETKSSNSTSAAAASGNSLAGIEDDAYLMSLVDHTSDSLLPSTMMTFSGLFGEEGGDDGTNGAELNADELNDIASLLAPQVSDDDASDNGLHVEIPILPKATVAASGNLKSKRSLAGDNSTGSSSIKGPASKKTKTTKAMSKISTAFPIPKGSTTPNPLSLHAAAAASSRQKKQLAQEQKTGLAPLAPKSSPFTASAKVKFISAAANNTTSQASGAAVLQKAADAAKLVAEAAIKAEAPKSSSSKMDDSDSNNGDAEQRAQQCRDRNRQHARNTRLRKKAYVEELKRSLREMVDQRDAALERNRQNHSVEKQQREVRFQVMQDFLQLRAHNERHAQRWSAILIDDKSNDGGKGEEEFNLTLPVTHFQTMVHSNDYDHYSQHGEQTLKGVAEIMEDSQYFASFLQSLSASVNGDVSFTYHCDRSNFLMDGCQGMLTWTSTTSGMGDNGEITLSGSMRARFCPHTNRLAMVKMHFDTGLIERQLATVGKDF